MCERIVTVVRVCDLHAVHSYTHPPVRTLVGRRRRRDDERLSGESFRNFRRKLRRPDESWTRGLKRRVIQPRLCAEKTTAKDRRLRRSARPVLTASSGRWITRRAQ